MPLTSLALAPSSRLRTQIQDGRLPAVQILRGLAALCVVLGHACFEARDFDRAGEYTRILDMDFWTAGVDLFFVLSGFIMMWTFGHRFGESGAWREFLRRRLVRIVPLYWVFTALMVVATLLFANRLESAVFAPGHALLSFLFIPHMAPHGGIHPILALGWTLMYEMFFYLSFALALCLRRPAGLVALAAFFLVVHGLALHPSLLPEALRLFWGDTVLFEFLFGVGFYFMQKKGQLPLSRLALVLLLCGAAGTAAWLAGGWSQNRVFHFGLPALALLALFYHLLPTVKAGIWLLFVLVGEASYTLYLSHPFMVELVKIPIEPLRMAAEGQIALYLATSIVVAALFSVAFYTLLEQQLIRRMMHWWTYGGAPARATIPACTAIPSSAINANDASPGPRSASIARHRQRVCVQGLGFVGAAMTAVLAQARDCDDRPTFDVVGLDLPTPEGLDRIGAINAGRFPFATTDPELDAAIRGGRRRGNVAATADASAYESADIVIVDVHLDVDFHSRPPTAKLDAFQRAIRTLGDRVRPGTLIIVETTVPPGTTENVVAPLLREGLSARGLDPNSALVAHSFERVMPGRDYLRSITNMWRVYSGVNEEAADACEAFLRKVINTADFPLTRLKRPIESETAKVMENSFRAANIAIIEEWARFAERAGVDLGAVIGAIRKRPTHCNIMRPGFGVGGYCLTKDPLLLGVGARDILGLGDLSFPLCEAAVDINQQMPRATLAMLRTALGGLGDKRILLLGASYREDVADTRYSPSTSFTIWAEAEGAKVDVHDPLVDVLTDIDRPVCRELLPPDGYHAAVFAVAHDPYRRLRPADWLGRERPLIVDANMVLSAGQLRAFCDAGCRVRVVGRGDL